MDRISSVNKHLTFLKLPEIREMGENFPLRTAVPEVTQIWFPSCHKSPWGSYCTVCCFRRKDLRKKIFRRIGSLLVNIFIIKKVLSHGFQFFYFFLACEVAKNYNKRFNFAKRKCYNHKEKKILNSFETFLFIVSFWFHLNFYIS